MSTVLNPLLNTVTHGDCVEVMRRMQSASADFILTTRPICAATSRGMGEPSPMMIATQ
ncbi:hypothetical protein [Bradyrhizobium sp. SZCCHNRI20481]|uniref:hypothetical protein n=1 Tax=Bradyrhizobium sp. SZCCHNRI20481 TaxID=3057286 RepID=UPI0029168FB9|nr:hypothetical protein [Bradyrhizobium sp. SZCCHNRI20481]